MCSDFSTCVGAGFNPAAGEVVSARVLCLPSLIWEGSQGPLCLLKIFSSALTGNTVGLLSYNCPQELSTTEEKTITNSYQLTACIFLGAELHQFIHVLIPSIFIDHLISEDS